MKVILSRKGLDSGFGGVPSPILPDGTLLSVPIPENDGVPYKSLKYGSISYSEILNSLNPSFNYSCCHLDPDLIKNICERPLSWEPCFGQSGSALSHLRNHKIGKNDIFLFFGWFRQTEWDSYNKLKYVKNAPDLHIIYGYMQVGQILDSYSDIRRMYWHPHASVSRAKNKLNCIYTASSVLLNTSHPGSATLMMNQDLVLTKNGYSRSKWELPECFVGKNISYHTQSNYKDEYFQSAMRGQEFVCECDDKIIDFIKKIANYNVEYHKH